MKNLLAICCLSMCSCAHMSTTPLDVKSKCSVDVLDDSDIIGKDFERVCLIEASSKPGAQADIEETLKRVKDAACDCGSDAVVIESVDQEGNLSFSSVMVSSSNTKTVGIVAWGIKYKEQKSESQPEN